MERYAAPVCLAALCGAAFCVFTLALIRRHQAYYSSAYDLAWFDQILWNTAHGHFLQSSFIRGNFLGDHFEPVLLLLVPFYRLWPSVYILFIAQALLVSLAAVPVYIAASRLLDSRAAGLMAAGALLLAPELQQGVLFDFHPELFDIFILSTAFAFLVYGRPRAAALTVCCLLLIKEDAILALAGFAWLIWLCGHRRLALQLCCGAAFCTLLIVAVIMPLNASGRYTEPARYEYLKATGAHHLPVVVTDPAIVVRHLAGMNQAKAVVELLFSQGLLTLASPALLGALPLTAAHLLSEHGPQNSLDYQYGVPPFTLWFLTALLGAAALRRPDTIRPVRRWLKQGVSGRWPAALLLGAELVAFLWLSPLGLHLQPSHYERSPHTARLDALVRSVPANASVSAQSGILPHLSERRVIREFPDLGDKVDVVLIDQYAWKSLESIAAGYDRVAASMRAEGYCLAYQQDGIELYRRGAACSPAAAPSVQVSNGPAAARAEGK